MATIINIYLILTPLPYPLRRIGLVGFIFISLCLWEAYFKNGKVQKSNAKITYPKYDETKLK